MLPLSRQGRNSLFLGIPSFLARCACAGTAQSPLTSCKPRREVSFPEPALGISMIPWNPLLLPDESHFIGTLFPRKPPVALQVHRGPRGVPILHSSWPGAVCTCLWLIKKMKSPTTGAGWELTSKLHLAWIGRRAECKAVAFNFLHACALSGHGDWHR